MSNRARLTALAVGLLFAGCATAPPAEVKWDGFVAWQGDSPIERLKAGHPDSSDPNMQLVSVDQAGTVALVRFTGRAPKPEILYRNRGGLTALCVADIDTAVPGEEIYAGGSEPGKEGWPPKTGAGGAVFQILPAPAGTRIRTIYKGSDYVHAIEKVDPMGPGEPTRLLVSDYVGQVLLLTPEAGAGLWSAKLLYREPPSANPEDPKVKDVAILADPSGAPAHEALCVLKTGRAIYVDFLRPETARLVHLEPGGLSRATPDDEGGAYVCGYEGRVLHFVREKDGFRVDVMHMEGKDSGLRGVVRGRFPVAGGDAPLAIFGYMQVVRTLTPRFGMWDATSLYRDEGKGHALLAADLFPGDGADELIMAGFTNRVTVIVARP